MKRYCQTLELRDDREMIEKYVEAHAHVWPEIQAGIRSVGILDMQIYILGNRLFMICDTVDDFDWRHCRDRPSGKLMWPNSRAVTRRPPRRPSGN